MSNQIIKYMWTEGELWDGSHSIFHLLFFLFSQIYNLSYYHLHLPSCALASYHPLLTTWTSKFDRTPSETRLPPEDRRNTDKRASQLKTRCQTIQLPGEKRRRRRKDKERSANPHHNRSRSKAWNLFSLVPLQIQDFKMASKMSHGNQ